MDGQLRSPGGRWRPLMWGAAGLLLVLPLIAQQFTAEVNWGGEDFLVFGAMLVAACAGFELVARLTARPAGRLLGGLAIAAVFLLVWAQLAVGIL